MDRFARAPHWAVGRFCGICRNEITDDHSVYADIERATDTGVSVRVECECCHQAIVKAELKSERYAYTEALLLLKHNDKATALDGLTARVEHARIQAARV